MKNKGRVKRHHYPLLIIILGISLRVYCNCSYRSIDKILKLIGEQFKLDLSRYPCANTVQNWVSKMGYFNLQQTEELGGKPVGLIIDESIRLGREKLLLILSVPWEKVQTGALQFKDVRVVQMVTKNSWNYEKIQNVLEELQEKCKFKIEYILSDEGSSIKKAVKQLDVPHLPDIAHALATCLRKTFSKNADYQVFTKLIGGYQRKAVNQALSYLRPPNQRSKARFMNQYGIVIWSKKMLQKFHVLNIKEQSFFKELPSHFSMIMSLYSCMCLNKLIIKNFRNFGLSIQTIEIARQILSGKKGIDRFVDSFTCFVEEYLIKYEEFLQKGRIGNYHVSSEIIESLFGKYKEKAAYCKLVGLTKLNLELPIHCLEKKELEQQISQALESTFMTDLERWENLHSSENQLIKRIEFFKNGT